MRSTTSRLVLALLAPLSFALLATAGASAAERGIVGGQETTIDQAPWQVALVDDTHYAGSEQFCGGVIVDASHVVTAAHCVLDPEDWSPDVVYAGTTDLRVPGQLATVGAISVHPAYDGPWHRNDVAVLTLDTPLTLDGVTARAAELAASSPADGALVTVSGWGDMSNGDGFYPWKLQAVSVHTVPDSSCASDYGPVIVPQTMLCASEPSGGRDSCSGDSGGPLVNAGTDVLVGIVSFGHECALAGYPGVYTEIAADTIRSFILGAIAANPGAPAPPSEPVAAPILPPPAPAPPAPPADAPAAGPIDTQAPRARVRKGHCTRSACTLRVDVRDPGVSAGIRGVEAAVRVRHEGLCRLHGRRTPCTRTTAARTVRGVRTTASSYRLSATGLPANASVRFEIVATDAAGHQQARPTLARLSTPARRR